MQRDFDRRKLHQSTDRFLESGQFHPRKIQPEVPARHAKRGKFQRHHHEHGTGPVGSQYHCVRIEYQPTIVTTCHVQFLDRLEVKSCAFDIQTDSLIQKSMRLMQRRSHRYVPTKHLLPSAAIYQFRH